METNFEWSEALAAPETPARLTELRTRYFQRREAAVVDLQEFFGTTSSRLATLTLEINVMDLLMVQRGLDFLLADWSMEFETRYYADEAVLIKRMAVEVAPQKFDFVIRCGRQFHRGPDGRRLAVDYWASDDRKVEDSQVTFTVTRDDYEWFNDLLPVLRKWMDANHFLRSRPITADGKFIRSTETATWEDVIMPVELRESLQRNCIDLLAHAGLYQANGVPLRRGILLHGPPGTGKTLIGRALSQHCGVTFILATPGMLEEPSDVRRVFDWGRRFAPAILFFEDFDLVAASRHGGGRRGIMGEFITCLDGLDSHEGIITIATTNDLKAIEPAMKERPNRFDCVLKVPELGEPQRAAFLNRWRERHSGNMDASSASPADVVEHTFDSQMVAERTHGFTGAQLQELCRLAVFEAVEEQIARGATAARRLPLANPHFRRALKKMGKPQRRPVGFTAVDDDED